MGANAARMMHDRRWPLLAAALAGLFLAGAFQYVVPQEQTSIYAEFGLNERTFGLVAGAVALLSTLLGVSAAWLVPRFGIAQSFLLGFPLFAVGLFGVTQAPGHVAPLLFGIVTAVGMAYLHLANGLVVHLLPDRPAAATNLLHGANALGKAGGPALSVIGATWREPFLVVAGLVVLAGALGAFGRHGTPVVRKRTDSGTESPAREALRQPLFWACALLFIPIVGMEQVVNGWLPRHLQVTSGLPAEEGKQFSAQVASVVLWTECILRLLTPLLLLRIPPMAFLYVCPLAAFGILIGTETAQWTGPLGTLGLVLCGIAFAAPYPTFFALACRFFPQHTGLLSVVSGAATSLAYISFTAMGGIVGHRFGLQTTLRMSPVLAMVVLIGVALVYRAGKRRERAAGGHEARATHGPHRP